MRNQQIHVEVRGIAETELLPLNYISLGRQLSPEHGDNCSAVRGKTTAAPRSSVSCQAS